MTSSLVGSEMCIRDRPSLPPPRSRVTKPGRGGQIVAGCLPKYPRIPVSYTHLTLPTICSV
eukprot:5788807-Prorocentrum_lima.AAC.1